MICRRFRVIKPEIRVVGIDDGVFTPHAKDLVSVIGVVFRGGYQLDGVMHTTVEVDGLDATEKITSMITRSPHHKQLRVIMLNGITFAGFNTVNIQELNTETKLPVIAVTRKRPNLAEIREALKKLPKSKERWKDIEGAGEIFEIPTGRRSEKVYMQVSGIFVEDAREILCSTSTRSSVPEALRVAHLIASGISKT